MILNGSGKIQKILIWVWRKRGLEPLSHKVIDLDEWLRRAKQICKRCKPGVMRFPNRVAELKKENKSADDLIAQIAGN